MTFCVKFFQTIKKKIIKGYTKWHIFLKGCSNKPILFIKYIFSHSESRFKHNPLHSHINHLLSKAKNM